MNEKVESGSQQLPSLPGLINRKATDSAVQRQLPAFFYGCRENEE